jgi:hypothetical protein
VKNYTIKKYQTKDLEQWNAFIDQSINGTFLFNRNFMDYHADRFHDFSLIIVDDEKWVAILPANVFENSIHSHQGLTYGGLVYNEKQKLENIIAVFYEVLKFLNQNTIYTLHVKTIPHFYNQKPAEELNYALFLANSKLIRRDALSVIDLRKQNKIASGRLEGVKKALNLKLEIREEKSFDSFWNEILIPNLKNKFNVKPVHSLQEIIKLHNLFPKNIRQFNVYQNDAIVAGTTIFESKNVAHAQYISGNESKSENGSLDFLYHHLITKVFANKTYFDFGTSNEEQGRKLNSGLNFWKESFGARTIVHDFYEIETKNFDLLENVII